MEDIIKKIEARIEDLELAKSTNTGNKQFDCGYNLLAIEEIHFLKSLLPDK